ncbi:MAG: hypothetical protein IIC67_01775 [Thaumarchaeota archaeon]|nr:hypothetical protein [Nitrososphaerota archaeon]
MNTRVLTLEFPKKHRCQSCDTILKGSLWNGIPIVLSFNTRNKKRHYKCIRCATRRHLTIQQVNDFLKEHMQIEVFSK